MTQTPHMTADLTQGPLATPPLGREDLRGPPSVCENLVPGVRPRRRPKYDDPVLLFNHIADTYFDQR